MNIPSISFALLSFSVLCMQISSILQQRIHKIELDTIKVRINRLELMIELRSRLLKKND